MGMNVASLLTTSVIPAAQFTTVFDVHTTTYIASMALYSGLFAIAEADGSLIWYYIHPVSMLGYMTSRSSLRCDTNTFDGSS